MMSEADQSIDVVSDKVTLESPENPKDIQVMSQDAVAALLAAYEETRLRTQPVFKSDGTRITADDRDLLFNYFLKYVLHVEGTPTLNEVRERNIKYTEWRPKNYGLSTLEKNKEYFLKSTKFVIEGNYSDEGPTGLGIGANVLLGIFGLDVLADGRDLFHNFTHWEWSWGHTGETLLNSIALVPFVGVVKNLKYSDEVLEMAKQADNIDDLVKGINNTKAFKDAAGNAVEIKKLADGTYELLAANGKVLKKIDDMPRFLDEMGIKIGKGPEFPEGTGKDLLSSNGKFKDAELQSKYDAYCERKYKAGETPKDPLEWKQASEKWANLREQGQVFSDESFTKFSQQYENAQREITIVTDEGTKIRVDAIASDEHGNIIIQEYKSSETAPYTPNQDKGFPELKESGGSVVGEGKGDFTEGYKIPSGTRVQIVRPEGTTYFDE